MLLDKAEIEAREQYDAARGIKIDSDDHIQQALRHLNACLDLKPTFVSALLLRANVASRSKNYQSAIADLSLAQQVLSSGLTVDKKRLASVFGTRASVYARQRKYPESLADLQKAMEIESDNGQWYYETGKVYLSQDNQVFAQYYFQASLNDKQYRLPEATKFKALFNLGLCRMNSGDTCGALATFMKAREITDTASLRNFMGLSSYRAGLYPSAVEHFARATDMNRHCLAYHFNLAVSCYRTGDLNRALQHFTAASLQGETAELLYYRGLVQLALGLFIHALVDFEKAIQFDSDARFHYAKTLLFMAQSKVDEAELSCKLAVDLAPSFRRCLAHQGIISHYRGQLHYAAKMLHAALELDQNDVILVERLGLVYSDLGFHDIAVQYFERCCTLEPDNGQYFFRKAVAQVSAGDTFGGHKSILIALETHQHETPMTFHVLSVALKKLGKMDDALHWAMRSIQRNPKHYKFYLNRGEILFNLGRYDECIADVKGLLKIKSTVGEAYFLRGRAYHAVKQYNEAVSDFEESAKLLPDLLQNEVYHYCCGVVYANAQMWSNALTSLTRAIQLSSLPTVVLYFHERAKVNQNLGEPLQAVNDLNFVIQYEPNNVRALLRRCFSLKSLEKFEEAANDWRKAKTLDRHQLMHGYDLCDLANIADVQFTSIFEEEGSGSV